MALDRTVVAWSGPLVILSGVVCTVAPGPIAEAAGIRAEGNALTDIRAIYGGLQLGLGLFLLWCRGAEERTTAGLLALGFALGGVAAVRLLGFLVDAAPDAFQLANLTLELATAALVVFALSRQRVAPA